MRMPPAPWVSASTTTWASRPSSAQYRAIRHATGRAAAMIGQGKIEASPMAMAAVVASVAAGETVIPHLIDGTSRPPRRQSR